MPKVLRDAVHGDIELGELEMELIDTPEFQRLRGIKQLGTACLVYPSATHTRFEHSLGTSWVAGKVVDAIRHVTPISEEDATVIRLAALLHDITHIPFGHTLEDERRVLPRHDEDQERLVYFLKNSTIGSILERSGYGEEIIRILDKGDDLRADIVGGAISADLLDYIRRDAYFCGLSQDYDDRIYRSFSTANGRLVMHLEKHGVMRHDALSELVNLLRIRYNLSERVYFHHTKLSSGAMISKTVELALEAGFEATNLRILRDDTLIWTLRQRFHDNGAIQHILGRLDSRQLYKPCFMLTITLSEDRRIELVNLFHHSAPQRAQAERAIAEACGLKPHEVIVYCPSIGMSLPEAEVPVRMAGGAIHPLSGSNNSEIRILKEKHQALWRFLVLIDRSCWKLEASARAAAEEYFGLPSER